MYDSGSEWLLTCSPTTMPPRMEADVLPRMSLRANTDKHPGAVDAPRYRRNATEMAESREEAAKTKKAAEKKNHDAVSNVAQIEDKQQESEDTRERERQASTRAAVIRAQRRAEKKKEKITATKCK